MRIFSEVVFDEIIYGAASPTWEYSDPCYDRLLASCTSLAIQVIVETISSSCLVAVDMGLSGDNKNWHDNSLLLINETVGAGLPMKRALTAGADYTVSLMPCSKIRLLTKLANAGEIARVRIIATGRKPASEDGIGNPDARVNTTLSSSFCSCDGAKYIRHEELDGSIVQRRVG